MTPPIFRRVGDDTRSTSILSAYISLAMGAMHAAVTAALLAACLSPLDSYTTPLRKSAQLVETAHIVALPLGSVPNMCRQT